MRLFKIIFFIFLINPISINGQDFFELVNKGHALFEQKKFLEAATKYEQATNLLSDLKWKKFDSERFYLLTAKAWACTNNTNKALDFLKIAVEKGFLEIEQITTDGCLSNLKHSHKLRAEIGMESVESYLKEYERIFGVKVIFPKINNKEK